MSSTYTSFIPLRLIGMLTISSLPSPNGMSLLNVLGVGTRCWIGECRSRGFQSSSCNKTFARSHIGSAKAPHLWVVGRGDWANLQKSLVDIRALHLLRLSKAVGCNIVWQFLRFDGIDDMQT